MQRRLAIVAALAVGSLISTGATAASFTDDFSGPLDPAWVTDRYAPPVLNTAGGVLNIGTDNSAAAQNRSASFKSDFYNTQGIQRAVGGVGPSWTVSGDLYISSLFGAGTTKMRSDLWVRDDNAAEANAQYPILGVTNGDLVNAYGNAPVAPRFRAWDSNVGWIELGAVSSFGALDKWYNLSITSTGSAFEFRIDGNLVYTDNTYSAAGAESLRTVFIEVFNFNQSTAPLASNEYAVQWDNVYAGPTPAPVVPTPAAALGGFGLLGALGLKRIGGRR